MRLWMKIAIWSAIALAGLLLSKFWMPGLIGLLALLPAFKVKLEQQRAIGAREQAERDRTAAMAERQKVAHDWSAIDEKTKLDEKLIDARWRQVQEGPTQADALEMLRRFKN